METVPSQLHLGLLPMAQPIASQPIQPGKKKSFLVTPVHDLLLRDLHTLHRATADQLTRLNYKPGMLNTVKARLKELSDHRYVLPLSHPSIRLPYIYALDRKGLNYLHSLGIDVKEYFRPSREEETAKNFHFREHMLAISDILIAALLFEKSFPSFRIHSMLHERSFKNHPITATYTKSETNETKTIVPDAYIEFASTHQSGKIDSLPVLVELDRGTEDQRFFRKRIRSYIVFLKSRTFRTVFGIDNITIAFPTTADENRVNKMQEWTRKELALTNEPSWLGQLFLFTALPENMAEMEPRHLFLDQVWYTPSDGLQAVSLLGE
jgi:Replication-relaxation